MMFKKAKHRRTRWTRTKHLVGVMVAGFFPEYMDDLVTIRAAY